MSLRIFRRQAVAFRETFSSKTTEIPSRPNANEKRENVSEVRNPPVISISFNFGCCVRIIVEGPRRKNVVSIYIYIIFQKRVA